MIEIDNDENTVIEIDRDEEQNIIREKSCLNTDAKSNTPIPGKQRDFVQLLNKSVLSDSLQEVNKILVGIEQDLANNDNKEILEKQSNENSEEASNGQSSDKSIKVNRPKKTISFCL